MPYLTYSQWVIWIDQIMILNHACSNIVGKQEKGASFVGNFRDYAVPLPQKEFSIASNCSIQINPLEYGLVLQPVGRPVPCRHG